MNLAHKVKLQNLLDKKFIFFGGKGGVGKTTSASAFSLFASEKGKRVLLVSTDPAHSIGDIFKISIGPDERIIQKNLWGIEIDPEIEAKKYIDRIKNSLSKTISPILIDEIKRQIDIAYVSPGAEEGATFDKFIELMERVREGIYDMIVFDTAPTGHTLRLLSLPEILEKWIDTLFKKRRTALSLKKSVKKIKEGIDISLDDDPILRILKTRKYKFQKARELLLDKNLTSYIFVLNPERLPILETKKAITILSKYKIPIGGIIVNRVLPKSGGEFLKKRKEVEKEYLDLIKKEFDGFILINIPLLEKDIYGIETLNKIKSHFK